MLLAAAVLLIAVTVLFTFSIRAKDMPAPEPLSPTRHLDERRAAIYENLRDLQFEYRVGKLSDADYQQTKVGLQKELAGVLSEIEKVNSGVKAAPAGATTVFKSVGLAVEDIAAAKLVYDALSADPRPGNRGPAGKP